MLTLKPALFCLKIDFIITKHIQRLKILPIESSIIQYASVKWPLLIAFLSIKGINIRRWNVTRYGDILGVNDVEYSDKYSFQKIPFEVINKNEFDPK